MMNVVLFEEHEIESPLSAYDPRTVHLLKVLHKKAGDGFDAGVLGGCLGRGRIEKINGDGSLSCSLELNEEPPPRIPIRTLVGFPRPIQLKRLLRDMASLGVSAVDLIGTDLGEKSYMDAKLITDGGARNALIEGAVQARDTNIPALSTYPSLNAWLKEHGEGDGRIAMDNVRPQGSMSLFKSARPALVLAVGSERGWSDRERGLLEEAGFERLSMGARALRTETACVAAVVLAMEKIGKLE